MQRNATTTMRGSASSSLFLSVKFNQGALTTCKSQSRVHRDAVQRSSVY